MSKKYTQITLLGNSVYHDSLNLYKDIMKHENLPGHKRMIHSLGVLAAALRMYTPQGIAIAFNGGKDATVILHLFRAALAHYISILHESEQHPRNGPEEDMHIQSLYITDPDSFEQVDLFVEETNKVYEIDVSFQNQGFKNGIKDYIELKGNKVKAFVLGTRRCDPHGAYLEHFSPSSDSWPLFMRINPVLEWNYADVWTFLRTFQLPYCSLYDEGYTSLGNVFDTWKNPELLDQDGIHYLPAYQLVQVRSERAGRSETDPTGLVRVRTKQSLDLIYERQIKTAGIVIIGSEILAAKTKDLNAHVAANQLRKVGIEVCRIAFVPDNKQDIIDELDRQSRKFDVVFTSGGVGATHDDITLECIADLFVEPLKRNAALARLLKMSYGENAPSHILKIADVPESAYVTFLNESMEENNDTAADVWDKRMKNIQNELYPVVKTRNIFSLPGVPKFFDLAISDIVPRLSRGFTFHSKRILLAVEEQIIAREAGDVAASTHHVNIGVYPFKNDKRCKTIITVESRDPKCMNEAYEKLLHSIKAEYVIQCDDWESLDNRDDL